MKKNVCLLAALAITAVGCDNHLDDPVWGPPMSFDCIPGEVINSSDCTPGCEVGTTHTVCNEDGDREVCRLRPGAECSHVPPGPCNGEPVGNDCELCGVDGITACVGGVVRCVPDHAPREICGDGIDNDCNGLVDDDCGSCPEGETRPCGTNVGACVAGTQTCSGGSWGSCEGSLGPQPEICNGIDDNCDGTTDEGCSCENGTTQSCGSDIGECVTGTRVCSGGSWGSCEGSIGPVSEICGDGRDNDCDGSTDEDCGECSPGATESCVTTCGTSGTRTCNASRFWNPCQPPAETCNGVDDNCNGAVDETCACVHGRTRSCGTDIGSCIAGTETCSTGTWGSCVGGIGPSTETCNGVDDNCNGTTDEGCACTNGATRSCGTSTGECSAGTETCVSGAWSSCTGSVGPSTEVCDSTLRDEDCDGLVNEGCACTNGATRSCGTSTGACSTGTETCSGGAWSSCSGGIGPVTEICGNGVDDDCDGSVDEGCAPVCTVTNGGVEACDGIDNDCDGSVDEGALGEFVGSEFCVGYGPSVPPLLTYDGTPVSHADIIIFDCVGTMRSFTISASQPYACIPLGASCAGWVATTYFQGSSADVNDIGSWYSSASSNYRGRSASSLGIRVFGRTLGQPDQELSTFSWVEYDPSGSTVPSGGLGSGTLHVGERPLRLEGPVRGACAGAGEYPPDRF